jgi:hypothetical protein
MLGLITKFGLFGYPRMPMGLVSTGAWRSSLPNGAEAEQIRTRLWHRSGRPLSSSAALRAEPLYAAPIHWVWFTSGDRQYGNGYLRRQGRCGAKDLVGQ